MHCDVAALLAAVATTTQVFWDVEPAAGKLLLPYLAWTAYATVLNAWIWNHNPRVRQHTCLNLVPVSCADCITLRHFVILGMAGCCAACGLCIIAMQQPLV